MTLLPSLRSRQVVRALKRLGFEQVRQTGGHALFHHPDCRRAPLPIHPNQEISPYFLADVLKELKCRKKSFWQL